MHTHRQFDWGFHVSRFFEFRAKSQDAKAILISAFPHFEHKSDAAFCKYSIFGLFKVFPKASILRRGHLCHNLNFHNFTCHDFLNFAPTPS
jgi:hypothetical protein